MKIDSHKIIFLHPGKTGGTSIEHSMRDAYLGKDFRLIPSVANRDIMFGFDQELGIFLQHACLSAYARLHIPYESYQTIATIRRPYERILSCFYYNGKAQRSAFEDFVTQRLEKCCHASLDAGYAVSHFAPQSLYAAHGCNTVEHIIRLEHFREDCSRAGLDVKYHCSKTAGVAKYKNRMDAYSNKTKDIVYSLYKDDFALGGYDK